MTEMSKNIDEFGSIPFILTSQTTEPIAIYASFESAPYAVHRVNFMI
jgi:hypothetical protein